MIEPQKLPDHDARIAAARAAAGWYLGSPSWADKLVAAYCNPAAARAELARERETSEETP